MKSIINNILGVAVILLTFTACQDWLDMPSESSTDTSSVFESVSRAEMAVLGAYASLHTQELGYQLLMGTDEITSTESNSKYNVSNYDYTTTTSVPASTYTSMYTCIEYANVCIANLPNMSASSDSEQTQIDALLGESYAIRAYCYWNLVRFFGDVPFTETPTSELTTFTSGRTSRDTIYDHCIADLQRAIDLLPWLSEGYVETPERFSKGAAYGILARVALYAAGYSLRWDLSTTPYDASTVEIAQREDASRITELYQIAADACKAVIDQGENSLLDDYDEVFRNLGNQTYDDETMFEYGWYSTNASDVRTGYTNGVPSSGTSSVLGKVTSQMMSWPPFYFEYEEGDQRRDISICNYALVFGTTDEYQMNTYAGMGVGKYRVNWKKELGASSSKRDIDWPILRYSDVLLMYAEALNELNNGPTSAAISAVKQVRTRAFGSESLIGDIPTTYDDFKDFIIQERRLELSGEGLRKTDLCRWGILVDYLTEEKEKLIRLCNREEEYADVKPYWAYRLTAQPQLDDPVNALDFVEMDEDDVSLLGLSDDELTSLHTINSSSKGSVTCTLYEDSSGNVYFEETDGTTGYEYTILNMFSINTVKQKGNLAIEDNDTWDGVNFISSENTWITGNAGVFYGMVKNMVEIIPLNQTSIIDVNAGLTDQQHPCY